MQPRAYFERALEAFEQAAHRAGLQRHDLLVAGTTMRLHFAGGALIPAVLPALAHLESPSPLHGPGLDLYLFDDRSTATTMPIPEWPLDAYLERGEISAFGDGDIRAAFSVDGPLMELWDRTTNRAIAWARDARTVPYYERGAPIRRVLSWWLAHNRRQMIHAAAVGGPDGCVLLAGKGGSGKSNTALGALGAGLLYLADDYCALEASSEPVAHSLYSTGKVHADDLARLPFLVGKAVNVDRLANEKALFFFRDHYPAQIRSALPIRALVMPMVATGAPSAIEPASPAEAARAVAMSTIIQLPYAGGEVLQLVASAARRLPAYRLRVGADAATRVPALLHDLIRSCLQDVRV